MPNTKISALPTASALGGTEAIPIVQDGVTVRATPTQINTFVRGAGGAITLGANALIEFDAADAIAQRRGVNAQIFRIYNTFTDASNYERGFARWSSNTFEVGSEAAGTGTLRNVRIRGNFVYVTANGGDIFYFTASGMFAAADNTYDIGASGASRPRDIYAGTSVRAPRVQTTALTVVTLPAAGTAGAGARAFVTDATVAASGNFGATVTGGGANGVPVYSDGTNWRIG